MDIGDEMNINEIQSFENVRQNYLKNSGYIDAMARFEDILVNKLGIDRNLHVKAEALDKVEDFNRSNASMFNKNGKFDVRSGSGESIEKIDAYLKGTPMEGMGKVFKHAENRFGVNAYFLASIGVLESGYGRSAIARDKKNLFGFGAYDDDPYKHAHKFQSFEEGVVKVAKHLDRNYLTNGGDYYRGTTVEDIGKSYATSGTWAKKIEDIIHEMIR